MRERERRGHDSGIRIWTGECESMTCRLKIKILRPVVSPWKYQMNSESTKLPLPLDQEAHHNRKSVQNNILLINRIA